MTPAAPRRDREEVARLGQEIYDRRVQPLLKPEDDGKFVAIDIVTEEYEIDADDYTVTARLRARVPTAHIWLLRVGHPTAYKLGLR